ncbi:MAG: hypothetical protein KIT82_23030 [Bradyrhizobium sp.]|nr:hypothetical protein [Bradyrhizobium sp.]
MRGSVIALIDRIQQHFRRQQRGSRELLPSLVHPSISAAVEATVASRLGCVVTHIESVQVKGDKPDASRRKRKYMRHVLRAGAPVNRELIVFTKTGWHNESEGVERFLAEQSVPEFRAPGFYGRAATVEGDTGIWEYMSHGLPQLMTLSRDDLRRVVRAAAAVNALTPDAVRHVPGLRVGTMYREPVADKLRAALLAEETMLQRDPSLRDALDRFAALEAGALARLASIGDRYFSHQDISGGNVLVGPAPAAVVILDWESAAIAAPGASLRRLERLDAETRLEAAQHYVDCLQAKGMFLEVADVLFVMCTVNVFARLHNGAAQLSHDLKLARKNIRSTLTRAPAYLL